MIRYITWGLFLLFTFGMVDVYVYYRDGVFVEYNNWVDKILEKIERAGRI